jgi:hypothetical protein
METLAMLARTSTVLGRKMENKQGPEGLVCLVGGGASRPITIRVRDAAGRWRER